MRSQQFRPIRPLRRREIREQTVDAKVLAQYGPKASAAAEGHPLKPLAVYGAMDHLEGEAVEGAVIRKALTASGILTPFGVKKASLFSQ